MSRIVLLVVLVTASAGSLGGHQTPAASPRVIHIVAERFSFTPSRITVDEGTLVELRITSEDTAHGFRLIGPGNVDVEIPKRGRGDRRITLPALDAGSYTFECSRVCGAGHDFMRGTVQVKAREPREPGPAGDRP